MEEKKEQCLKIAFDCFTTVDKSTNLIQPTDDDSHDEKWLYHYMLGKIAEKRKEQPNLILDHYLKSAKFLYEHNATYPFKISFTNPQNLALEALEIFYRITAAIIKYVEQNSVITRAVGKYFMKVLKGLSNSPFALSQAKINGKSFEFGLVIEYIAPKILVFVLQKTVLMHLKEKYQWQMRRLQNKK